MSARPTLTLDSQSPSQFLYPDRPSAQLLHHLLLPAHILHHFLDQVVLLPAQLSGLWAWQVLFCGQSFELVGG